MSSYRKKSRDQRSVAEEISVVAMAASYLLTEYDFSVTPQGRLYATSHMFPAHGAHLVSSASFAALSRLNIYRRYKIDIDQVQWQAVLNLILAFALKQAKTEAVWTRVAWDREGVYIHIGHSDSPFVEVHAGSWGVCSTSPFRFWAAPYSGPRTIPIDDESYTSSSFCRDLLLKGEEDTFETILHFMIDCLLSRETYPILEVSGPEGFFKANLIRTVRDLVDPTCGRFRLPQNRAEIASHAGSRWLTVLEDVPSMPPWLVDSLRLLTSAPSELTEGQEEGAPEHVFLTPRPVLISSFSPVLSQQCEEPSKLSVIPISCPSVQRCSERLKKELTRNHWAIRARQLGFLLTAIQKKLVEQRPAELAQVDESQGLGSD